MNVFFIIVLVFLRSKRCLGLSLMFVYLFVLVLGMRPRVLCEAYTYYPAELPSLVFAFLLQHWEEGVKPRAFTVGHILRPF